jgi:hypothetical protein
MWRKRAHELLRYWSKSILAHNANMILSSDPLTPQKTLEVIFWPKALHLWSLKVKDLLVVQLLIANRVYIKCKCELNLWPPDPQIKSGNLLPRTYAPMQFEGQRPMGCNTIDREPFLLTRSIWSEHLTFWPMTNAAVQFEGQQTVGCQFIYRKPFLPIRSIWHWPLIP